MICRQLIGWIMSKLDAWTCILISYASTVYVNTSITHINTAYYTWILIYFLMLGFPCLQKNIVHRDLKLGNMVLNKSTRRVTLTNFCLGKHLISPNDPLKDQRGSPAYISPDVLSGERVGICTMGLRSYRMWEYHSWLHNSGMKVFRELMDFSVFRFPKYLLCIPCFFL